MTTNGSRIKKGSGIMSILNWTADDVYFWANWWLIGALAMGVVTTGAVIVSGSLKESALRKEIAETKERAARLEKEAADARLETEKLKALVIWRVIKPTDLAALTSALSDAPGIVHLEYPSNDPEAMFFAIQLSKAFSDARWRVYSSSVQYNGTMVFGLLVSDVQTPSAQKLRGGLSSIGIIFRSDFPSVGTIGFGGDPPPPDAVRVMVGSQQPRTL